jgi:hypothetical protein
MVMMKFCRCIGGFFVIALLFSHCTNKEITKRDIDAPNMIGWSESIKLSWDDFQGAPILTEGSIVSELVVKNPSSIERRSLFAKTKLTAQCYFDKSASWVNRKYATDELLLYNQTIFDIYELYVRKLRQAYDSTSFSSQDPIKTYNALVDRNNQELTNRIRQLRAETKMGADYERVKLWSEKILIEILSLDKYK